MQTMLTGSFCNAVGNLVFLARHLAQTWTNSEIRSYLLEKCEQREQISIPLLLNVCRFSTEMSPILAQTWTDLEIDSYSLEKCEQRVQISITLLLNSYRFPTDMSPILALLGCIAVGVGLLLNWTWNRSRKHSHWIGKWHQQEIAYIFVVENVQPLFQEIVHFELSSTKKLVSLVVDIIKATVETHNEERRLCYTDLMTGTAALSVWKCEEEMVKQRLESLREAIKSHYGYVLPKRRLTSCVNSAEKAIVMHYVQMAHDIPVRASENAMISDKLQYGQTKCILECNLTTIPTEIILEICQKLDPASVIRLANSCRTLNHRCFSLQKTFKEECYHARQNFECWGEIRYQSYIGHWSCPVNAWIPFGIGSGSTLDIGRLRHVRPRIDQFYPHPDLSWMRLPTLGVSGLDPEPFSIALSSFNDDQSQRSAQLGQLEATLKHVGVQVPGSFLRLFKDSQMLATLSCNIQQLSELPDDLTIRPVFRLTRGETQGYAVEFRRTFDSAHLLFLVSGGAHCVLVAPDTYEDELIRNHDQTNSAHGTMAMPYLESNADDGIELIGHTFADYLCREHFDAEMDEGLHKLYPQELFTPELLRFMVSRLPEGMEVNGLSAVNPSFNAKATSEQLFDYYVRHKPIEEIEKEAWIHLKT